MIRPRFRLRRRLGPDRPSPHALMPPEGVPIVLRVARIGTRVAAQLADILITLVGAVALLVLLIASDMTEPETVFALAALLFFAIRVPYYIVSELVWNGQTLGKRLMSIKVVSEDGGPLTAHGLVARNLMKEAEVFLPATLVLTLDSSTPIASFIAFGWILATLLVPLLNPRRRRLGDMMAGTYVVQLPVPILLSDVSQSRVATPAAGPGYRFFPHQLDHYGVYELQTLEDLLRASDRPGRTLARGLPGTLAAVVERIRLKIGYAEPVPAADHLGFLKAFYNAQRAHLEQRQLFGERREDKFHRQPEPETDPNGVQKQTDP